MGWRFKRFATVLSVAASLAGFSSKAADEITLGLSPLRPPAVLEWHSRVTLPISSMYSEYYVERSSDLRTWQIVGGPFSGGIGVSDELLRQIVPTFGDASFYRIAANRKLSPRGAYGDG